MEFVLEGWVEFDKKLKCFIFKKNGEFVVEKYWK